MRQTIRLAVAATIAAFAASAAAAQDADCPATSEDENVAIVAGWHEEVINNRNPSHLGDILAPEVKHHAAGGYPRLLDADGIASMMDDFLVAFPDLRYTFDLVIAKDAYVVHRYTATGTQEGDLGAIPASGRQATWTGVNIFRVECGRIAEVWSEVDAISRNRQLTQ